MVLVVAIKWQVATDGKFINSGGGGGGGPCLNYVEESMEYSFKCKVDLCNILIHHSVLKIWHEDSTCTNTKCTCQIYKPIVCTPRHTQKHIMEVKSMRISGLSILLRVHQVHSVLILHYIVEKMIIHTCTCTCVYTCVHLCMMHKFVNIWTILKSYFIHSNHWMHMSDSKICLK